MEKIDWAQLENEYMQKTYCPGCYKYKRKQEYHLCEWNKDKDRGHCKICIAGRIKDGIPFECNECNDWFCAEAFELHQRDHRSTHTRICIGCLERRLCIKCGEEKKRMFYSKMSGSMLDTMMVKGNVKCVVHVQQMENGIVKVAVKRKTKQIFHNI